MPFQRTLRTTISRQIHAPKKTILQLLHDPPKFFVLNPLVTDVRPHEDIPDRWIVTDILSFAGGCWKKILEYHVHSKTHENGVHSEITANSMGFEVVTSSKFVVKEMGDGVCEVVEDYEIHANAILMPYIKTTQESAHKELMDKLKQVLEQQ